MNQENCWRRTVCDIHRMSKITGDCSWTWFCWVAAVTWMSWENNDGIKCYSVEIKWFIPFDICLHLCQEYVRKKIEQVPKEYVQTSFTFELIFYWYIKRKKKEWKKKEKIKWENLDRITVVLPPNRGMPGMGLGLDTVLFIGIFISNFFYDVPAQPRLGLLRFNW